MIPFTIESKSVRLRNKFHERRIGLTHTKKIHKMIKALERKTKEDLNEWKDTQCAFIRRFNNT